MKKSNARILNAIFRQPLCALLLCLFLVSCGEQVESDVGQKNIPKKAISIPEKVPGRNFEANKATEIDPSVLSILQDKQGNYWFGTNAGVFRYDGTDLILLTTKDGLFQNQVQDIQEDESGNIWFSTGGFGVNRFDGANITTLKIKEGAPFQNPAEKPWKTAPGDLWFCAGGGAFRYGEDAFNYLPFPQSGIQVQYAPNAAYQLSAQSIYTTLKDRKGRLWFGTQAMGVCHYDGQSFTWLTGQGLQGPAVLAVFEDSKGILWFGNNGKGLFRYDGKTLRNVTEEKGLGNPEFIKTGKSGPKSLARVWALNEDNDGHLWIGTGDAGVWRYDGNKLTQYTTRNGLPDSGIETIYKDKKGKLWFGTDGDGVYQFEAGRFVKFVI